MMKPTFVDTIEFSGYCLGNFLCIEDDEFVRYVQINSYLEITN